MRWLIHGTDAITGRDLELAVDEYEAPRAVKAAIDRQIVVDRVTSVRGGSARRFAAIVAIVLLAAATAGLVIQNLVIRRTLQQALDEQTQLAQSVAHAEETVKDIRDHGNLATGAAAQVGKLAEELANSRGRISRTEQQLVDARRQVIAMEEAAGRVPELEKKYVALHEQLAEAQRQLDQSRELADQFRAQTVLQGRRLDELETLKPSDEAAAKVAQLDAANRDLAGQIDKLKNELLIAAARSTIPDASPMEAPAVAVATPWALGMTFDAARDFLMLHSDRDSAATLPAANGLLAIYGMQSSNAVRVQFLHDKAKERVYSATLSVSLAPDAPKNKLDENRKTIADFLAVFTPSLKSSGEVPAAISQLSGMDESRRIVFLTADAKLTLWNNKGVYTLRVESPRGDAE